VQKELLERLLPITEEESRLLQGNPIDRDLYMEQSGNVVNAEKLLEAGKLITLRPHTRFVDFPPHSHDYVEVVYMCQGTTSHTVNGQRLTLHAGELLFLSQHAVQEIAAAGADDVAVNLIILPPFFDRCLEMIGEEETPLRRFVLDALSGKEDGVGFLHFRAADILPVQNLMENLLWTLIENIPNKRRINQTTMGLLFMHLLNNVDQLAWGSEAQPLMLRVMQYVEEHYQDGTLGEAAALLGQETYTLSREIKRKTGRTFTALLQEKRLSQAAFLLAHTTLKVEEIANAVGYYNLTFFHRLFAERYGQSPKKYRDCK